MRFIITFLSILLIFAGIAGVLYVDLKANESTDKISASIQKEQSKSEKFAKKLSMREIDSITSEKNYSFTIHNAVAVNSIDTLQSLTLSQERF